MLYMMNHEEVKAIYDIVEKILNKVLGEKVEKNNKLKVELI